MKAWLRSARKSLIRLLALLCAKIADVVFDIFRNGSVSVFRRWQLWLLGVQYGDQLRDGFSIYIHAPGRLRFGSRCALGGLPQFWNYEFIEIGDDFIAGPNLVISTATHDVETLRPQGRAVKIGNRVWCGANVLILPGISVGDDAIIAAGAVVAADVASGTLVGGVPAKPIRTFSRHAYWSWVDNQLHNVASHLTELPQRL